MLLAAAAALALTAAAPPGGAQGGPVLERRGEPPGAGERLYREGRSPGGEVLRATVLGDVETGGGQVSCAACHGRSGVGAAEGTVLTPPITAAALFSPRPGGRGRPAYDAGTLVRALREGVDPAGRTLDPLMPRYRLGEDDARRLVAYLAGLSAGPPPGVEDRALHLAVVLAPDASPAVREETLAVARSYVASQNAAARDARVRHRGDLRSAAGRPVFYGDWVLHEWALRGPPPAWRRQLEHLQRARPVFAVVSGAGGAEWGPVQGFCEAERLPCVLPNLATPPGGAGWYALYFSRGTALEAEVIAAHAARAPRPARVLQVYRRGGQGEVAARALARVLPSATARLALAPDAPRAGLARRVAREARRAGASALALWLDAGDLAALGPSLPAPSYVSSTLLGGDLAAAAPLAGAAGWVVHPYGLPDELAARGAAQRAWLASRGLLGGGGAERERVRGQTLFAFGLLSQGLMHLARERVFQRDFLLETLDHAAALQNPSPHYPHLGFGPGQRYLSKGCHLVPLAGGEPEWLVP